MIVCEIGGVEKSAHNLDCLLSKEHALFINVILGLHVNVHELNLVAYGNSDSVYKYLSIDPVIKFHFVARLRVHNVKEHLDHIDFI
jgi:hypothetical protein